MSSAFSYWPDRVYKSYIRLATYFHIILHLCLSLLPLSLSGEPLQLLKNPLWEGNVMYGGTEGMLLLPCGRYFIILHVFVFDYPLAVLAFIFGCSTSFLFLVL